MNEHRRLLFKFRTQTFAQRNLWCRAIFVGIHSNKTFSRESEILFVIAQPGCIGKICLDNFTNKY